MARDYEIKTTFRAKDKATRTIGKIQSKVVRFTAKASMGMRKLNRVMSKVSGGLTRGLKYGFAAATAASAALFVSVSKLMAEFSKVEDAQAAFTPLMGGVKKAKELVDELNKTAATTPFQFENLSEVAKLFLPSVNGNISETIRLTRMMGDATGGNKEKFKSASVAMAKLMMTEKATQEHLGSFVIAGIPIYKELGEVLGVSTEKVVKLTRKGKVTADVMTRVFEKMTSAGGIFHNGMQIASETLTGKVSTLKDNVSLVAVELGSVLAPELKKGTDYLTGIAKKVKEWVIQNKGLIKSKVAEYIKKIPGYIEKIVYWAPKIGKVVLAFYAVSTAVKVVNTSMAIFNTLANVNLGPMKAMGAFMGKALPMKIGASTAAMTALQGAMVLGVGAAAVGLGLLIHQHIVEPLMKARHEANMMKAEHNQTMQGDLSKRNSATLKGDIEKADGVIRDTKKEAPSIHMAMGAQYGSGSAMAHRALIDNVSRRKDEKRALQSAMVSAKQRENISRYSAGPGSSDGWGVVTQSTDTSHREEVEVTIKDETGRARVTSGSSRRLKLAHSGGMP